MTNTYKYYLFDVGLYFKERALEARSQRDQLPLDGDARDFHSGRVAAFNEVISIMQQHAEAMAIPLVDLQLADIEPERDLV